MFAQSDLEKGLYTIDGIQRNTEEILSLNESLAEHLVVLVNTS